MADENCTRVTHFTLAGLTEHPHLRPVLFALFLGTYMLTLVGNLGIIVLVRVSPQLHTPMYFFLSNLSFLDICYSCTISPKMLLDLSEKHKAISFAGCLMQFYFYAVFATAEIYLLAAMAYDRYVAVCSPLLYGVIMSPALCTCLVTGCYLAGLLHAVIHTSSLLQLSFCGPHIINNFYCDAPPLFVLSSTDTWLNELVVFVFVGFNLTTTNLLIITSYTRIAVTIVRMRSAEGRRKACSTCASHLAAVLILYVSFFLMYLRPSSSSAVDEDKWPSVFSTVVIPLSNPLIYSLRNKEVKAALRRLLRRTMCP